MTLRPLLLLALLSACNTDKDAVDDSGPAATPSCGYTAAEDLDPADGVVEVALKMSSMSWDPGTTTLATNAMGFNGQIPGPLIVVNQGDTLRAVVTNDLDMAETIHWHGLRIPEAMDGVSQMMDPIEPGESFTYEFTLPDSGFYWYHPHMDTAITIEAGLYGAILVKAPDEPKVGCDLPLVLDDVLLDDDNQIAPVGTDMETLMGRLGNVLLANGVKDREVPVTSGQSVLLRLVNAANARFFDITLDGHAFDVVGSDGGWLETPYTTDELVMGPGDRVMIRFDADGAPGDSLRLMNKRFQLHDTSLEPDTAPMVEYDPMGEGENPVMSFVYGEGTTTAEPYVQPAAEVPTWTPGTTVAHHWVLDEDMAGGTVSIDGASWPDVPLVTVPGNTLTTFEVENASEMHHPFHIHGQRFQVVAIDGVTVSPPAWEDTFDAPPGKTTTIMSELDNPGTWMYHCHILEHADNGMAGLLTVE